MKHTHTHTHTHTHRDQYTDLHTNISTLSLPTSDGKVKLHKKWNSGVLHGAFRR